MLTRTPRTRRRVPQTMTEVETLERELSQILVQRELVHAQYEEALDALIAERDAKLKHYDGPAMRRARKISSYARRNRRSLANTFQVGNSEMGWRAIAPSVLLAAPERDIIKRVFEKGYDEFIRLRPSLDKNAMKKHPVKASRIPGVKVQGDLTFFIKPGGTELRLVRSSRTNAIEIVRPRRSRADDSAD